MVISKENKAPIFRLELNACEKLLAITVNMAIPARTSMNDVGTARVNDITNGEMAATTTIKIPASTAEEYLSSSRPISGPAIIATVGPPTTAIVATKKRVYNSPYSAEYDKGVDGRIVTLGL